jgi:hypothetical protein
MEILAHFESNRPGILEYFLLIIFEHPFTYYATTGTDHFSDLME